MVAKGPGARREICTVPSGADCDARAARTIDPSANGGEHWIILRESQVKVRHHIELDDLNTILHVNKVAKVTVPGSITWQVISVLHDRGVPLSAFQSIIDTNVNGVAADLMGWEPLPGESMANVRRRLILAIQRGGAMLERVARHQRALEKMTAQTSSSEPFHRRNQGPPLSV